MRFRLTSTQKRPKTLIKTKIFENCLKRLLKTPLVWTGELNVGCLKTVTYVKTEHLLILWCSNSCRCFLRALFSVLNREEKSLCHFAKVAKFLDDNKPKTSRKKWTRTVSNFVALLCVQCWWNFLGLNSKGAYLSLEKKLCLVHVLHKAGRWNRKVSCRSCATTAKICTKCKVFSC